MKICLLGEAVNQRERLGALLSIPHEIVCVPDREGPRGDDPLPVDVVVSMRFDRHDAERFPCRLLHLPGAGAERIAFAALPDACWVCNVYEHEGPIAEYVLLAMLQLEIRLFEMSRAFNAQTWTSMYRARQPHGELAGKTVGIVGFGHIAREIARRAKPFGMRVLAVTRTPRAGEAEADWVGPLEALPELLAQSDFVVVACPLNGDTRGVIGSAQLRLMKRSAFLINVARAEIVVEEDLYRALAGRAIAGAALDVWYRYPVGGSEPVAPSRFPFHELPGVLCTPHSSAWTDALFDRRCAVIARNIERFAAGQPLQNVIHAPQRSVAR
jgi:phosphoglycerate dehydrogenase-like enzyme